MERELVDAIKIYEGDVRGFEGDNLFGDPKLYVSLNSLFFSSTMNESLKVKEGKVLNPNIILRHDEIVGENGLCEKLFKAAREYAVNVDETVVYRVERFLDFKKCLDAGETIAFTSTSKSGFLGDYTDKKRIVLMEIHISKNLPCIDFKNVLDEYAKGVEEEILLMPHTKLVFTETDLSDSEKQIKDFDGNPPAAKYIVCAESLNHVEIRDIQYKEELIGNSVNFMNMLNDTKGWVKAVYACAYRELKKYLQNEINKRFLEIFQKGD